MKVIKAPEPFAADIRKKFSVFLAGSIEMGKAENWQEKVERLLADEDIIVLNPRRDDWDSSWEQVDGNNEFTRQVVWELAAQDHCHMIVFYFAPGTQSPITLLELGLAKSYPGKVVVCCPEGFWRKGNVDVTCKYTGIKLVDSIEELVNEVKKKL